ncbi:MAG: S-adenosyl-l-methionine hydroxide adenosyltransferase family protein [Acidimicrobiales bacterium]
MSQPGIFFLSDYGTADEYVGVVHAVLLRLAHGVPVVDLTHEVAPFDVEAGSLLLARCAPYLGAGVVLAVVDPGVGTDRRGVAVGLDPGGPDWLVGPDNGLLTPLAVSLGGPRRLVELDPGAARPARAGPVPAGSDRTIRTFDGRDVFAPAAAHLVRGGDPQELGPAADPGSLVRAPATSRRAAERIEDGPAGPVAVTTVRRVDRFGNVELGLEPAALAATGLTTGRTGLVCVIEADGADEGPAGRAGIDRSAAGPGRPVRVRLVRAFSDLGPGELGLLLDSAGRVAVVLDRASAARHLGLSGPGDVVRIGPAAADATGH